MLNIRRALFFAFPMILFAADSVEICGNIYKLPYFWSGYRIPDSARANRSELVPVPERLLPDNGQIYILDSVLEAIIELETAALEDSVHLEIESGFRSVKAQENIWCGLLDMGIVFENIIGGTAPPGYSEHHTGRAVDFYPSTPEFYSTDAYWWLKHNAPDYGWRQSYSVGEGVKKEPWHWYYEGDQKPDELAESEENEVNTSDGGFILGGILDFRADEILNRSREPKSYDYPDIIDPFFLNIGYGRIIQR